MSPALVSPELFQAYDAFARRDSLTAVQLALRAARRQSTPPSVRCDAYMLLTLAALMMESPEPALAYAVGANLLAHKLDDDEMEQQSEALLELVLAQYPQLQIGNDRDNEH